MPREALATAQTPQGFPFHALLAAHRAAAEAGRDDLTDDAAVAALAGLPVRAVAGDRANIKLTSPADFTAAETGARDGDGDAHARRASTCMPSGRDARYGSAASRSRIRTVWSAIRTRMSALHALTDALLGTIGDGDIGEHFPPSDPQWKGASSDRFLADAVRRVMARGGRIINLDVTLICEAPKIGPHRQKMQARVAEIAGIAPDRVGVKATTSEKMGFTGRGEGIVALAIATVALPAGP